MPSLDTSQEGASSPAQDHKGKGADLSPEEQAQAVKRAWQPTLVKGEVTPPTLILYFVTLIRVCKIWCALNYKWWTAFCGYVGLDPRQVSGRVRRAPVFG